MSSRLLNLIILVLFLLAACTPTPAAPSSAQEISTATSSSVTNESPASPTNAPAIVAQVPAEYQYIFEPPADPFQVTPGLEESAGAEAIIGPAGGSLTVSSADGTVFRLDLPAQALVTDMLIRMTPLGSLEGMPFGSSPLAVQLQPDGLQLYETAILTITPPQTIPIDQQLFFGYSGLGENLVLAPPVTDSNEIQLQVFHFSGYGVTKGFLADVEPVRARIGGDAERRIQSQVAELLTRSRQAALLGSAEPDLTGLAELFQAYQEQVVQPRVAAAGESCAAGRLAIQTVLGYNRQLLLLGMADDSTSLDYTDLMDTVAVVCMKEEYEMCRDDHIIHRIVPAWLGLERQYQLLGIVDSGASNSTLEAAKDYVKRCLNFELVFHSEGNYDDGHGGGFTSIVDSKIKLQFDPATLAMRNQAPLVNTDFTFRSPPCSVDSHRGGDTFSVMNLEYVSDTKTPTDELGYVRDMKLLYYPGNTTETYTITCEGQPPFSAPPSLLWTGTFLPAHQEEMSMESGGFLSLDWEIKGGELFASKEWIKDLGGGIVEVGTFKLYHKPQ